MLTISWKSKKLLIGKSDTLYFWLKSSTWYVLKVTKGGDISVILGLVIIQKKWKVIKKMWWYIIILCIEKVSYYAVLGKRWKWKVCLQSYDIFKSGDADDVEKLKVKKWWERRVGDRHKKVFDLPSSDAQGVPWWKTPPIGFVPASSKSPKYVILKVNFILIMLGLKRHISCVFCWCHMWKIISGCANSPTCAADHSSYPMAWIYLYLIMIMYLISLIKALYAHIM